MSTYYRGVFVFSAAIILASGCARSQSTAFYVLTSELQKSDVQATKTNGKQLVLGIGPIKFPEYLNRSQITGRSSGNHLSLAEFHRWAEPLESGFSRVLSENLSILFSTDRVLLIPRKSNLDIDYRVVADVIRFDGIPEKTVSLNIRWAIFGPDGSELVFPRRSTFVVQTKKSGYEGVAGAMSEAVGNFSEEISSEINKLGNNSNHRK